MTEPKRITDHGIAAELLDANAINVVNTLKENGYEAYLVGGCVRDLLCNRAPKDFDVATSATPEEVKELFRRARLVGRRFPIAHVRFGRDVIEVSTFRQGQLEHVETNDQGLIVKDLAFGTLEEDAFRRDFTINALYYDVDSNEIIDYVGGLADIEAELVRLIGEVPERLAEDPVRLLRAMRFAAKLEFKLQEELLDYVDETADRLEAIPGARLFDEFLKMFLAGYGAPVWDLLRDTPLVHSLFPSCNPDNPLIGSAMANTDQRISADQPVTPGFLVAVLLWDDFAARYVRDNPKHKPNVTFELAMDTLAIQQQHIAIPRRFSIFAREVWQLQHRLEERHPRNINHLLGHKRFRAAFDFLTLRAESDPALAKQATWWHEIQEASDSQQAKMIGELGKPGTKRRRRRRRRNNNPNSGNSQSGNTQPRKLNPGEISHASSTFPSDFARSYSPDNNEY